MQVFGIGFVKFRRKHTVQIRFLHRSICNYNIWACYSFFL